jgi:Cd2+/Zn2+-exporting ATPase
MSGTPFGIETLMSVAGLGAIAIGAVEEAAVVVFLFAVGEVLETVAAGHARAGIKALMALVPRTALVENEGGVREVPAESLDVGAVVLVRPGDHVPSDGEIIEGRSDIDEAPVTGESVPVAKTAGDAVFAGSINTSGSLRVRVTRTAANNTIARIIHLVEEAQSSKAPTARFIDRFSAYYTPAAMLVSAFIIVAPPLLFGAEWATWIYRGLATLLIACPCALVISTPAAIASGLAAGARHGLLIKGGAALETLGKVVAIAFDKTGTLTLGQPQLTDVLVVESDEAEILAQAAAVEHGSSHPLGLAIIGAAKDRGLSIPQTFGGSMAVPGKAVTARLKSGFVSVGSPRYAAEVASIPETIDRRIETLEAEGKTVVVVLAGKRLLGVIALRDEPRPDAAVGVSRLKNLGIHPLMLTGDNQRTGRAIASALGIDVKAELLPDAKLAEIAALKKQGPVAMIGDGINDAPALAAASVGVAMGGGTDVALEAADAALLKNRILGVVELIRLSRATLSNIWQNIALALGLKGIFLVTTLLGMTSLWMAILADTGATVLVTANALRLLRFNFHPRPKS